MAERIELSKKDRLAVAWRSTFLQGSWNYERMQNGGWCYAMVINMMSTKETWPFFAIGFVLAALSQLTLIALGALGVAIALIYLGLKENGGSDNGGSTGSGDPLGDILNDY